MWQGNLGRNHNRRFDGQLGIFIANDHRGRGDLLASQLGQSSLRGQQFVAISTASTSASLGFGSGQNVRADVGDHIHHLLANFPPVAHHEMAGSYQQSDQQHMANKGVDERQRLGLIKPVTFTEKSREYGRLSPRRCWANQLQPVL